ncbi:MAG: glucosaminidase domain-containing protein, partial [Rhodospirillales bacterium]|nr:glucosaminidase domain-containing protein [Rhodospirillales bacterium]
LIVMAVLVPVDRVARVPDAEFLPPDAVPEVVSAEEFRIGRVGDKPRRHTTVTLSRAFSSIGYDFHAVRAGERAVPRLFVTSLPRDMRKIRVAKKRKELFFKSILPLVLRVNEQIRADRTRLIVLRKMKAKEQEISAADLLWLAALADRYKADRDDLSELTRRTDIIPPSIALAQAAEESGWGTSRFVIEGNALFGQWTVEGDRGIVPARRDADRSHKIKVFETLHDAVRAYAHNLNTHRAYRQFRSERANLRRVSTFLNGLALSSSLSKYSERGEGYVGSLRSLIRGNRLEKLDGAKLSDKIVRHGRGVLSANSAI